MLPHYELASTVTPSPVNSLGVKGVGEAGTIGSTPCVVNAVLDALKPLGIRNSRHAAQAGEGLARDQRRKEEVDAMFPASFEYHRAASVKDALAHAHADSATTPSCLRAATA